jgi:hypothetical protein
MKKISLLILLAGFFALQTLAGGKKEKENNTCKRDEAAAAVKKDMVPFRYEKTTTTYITFKHYDQVKTIAAPLFFDNKYKFVINTEGLPKEIKVQVYDKPRGMRDGAKMIHESTEKQFSFEIGEDYLNNRVYIDYVIPAIEESGEDDITQKGCIVMGSGYENL